MRKASGLWNMQQEIFPEKWPKEVSPDTYTVCEVCKIGFSKKDHLQTYFLRNTGDKPICKVCKKKFSRTNHLQTHFLTHADKKLHVCEIWNNAFSQKGNLKQPFREKPYILWNMKWRIFQERWPKKSISRYKQVKSLGLVKFLTKEFL